MDNIKFIKSKYINDFIHYEFSVRYNNVDITWLYSEDLNFPIFLVPESGSPYSEMIGWNEYRVNLNNNFRNILSNMNNETNLEVLNNNLYVGIEL